MLMFTENLSIGYNSNKIILTNLSFSIARGECVCLMGANGTGKSTLLKTIAGIIPPLAGGIYIDDLSLESYSNLARAKKISAVLTDRVNPYGLTSREIISFGRYPHVNLWGGLSAADWDIVDETIEFLSLGDIANDIFCHLSDGQRQKVMIARALVQSSDILLLDEPTSFLDFAAKMEIIKLLRKIAKARNIAVLFSSHDWSSVLHVIEKVALIASSNNMIWGMPEDLIVSGQFEKIMRMTPPTEIFANDNSMDSIKTVALKNICGDSMVEYWTRNALNKCGIVITQDQSVVPTVEIISRQGFGWSYRDIHGSVVCNSLMDLVSEVLSRE